MVKVFSFGGGVQSTAALVLAAQGKIDYRRFLFCNVGEESENPATLTYLREVSMPFAKEHGLTLLELRHEQETLYQRMTGEKQRGYVIPAFFVPTRGKSKRPIRARRECTVDFKIKVVDKWLIQQGAKKQGAIVGLGISADEVDRVKPNTDRDTIDWKELAWPLLFDVPQAFNRQDCINIIEAAGLPVPPRSACTYCPHHMLSYWQDLRSNWPDVYRKQAEFERLLGDRQEAQGQPRIYFTRLAKPLDKITTEEFNQPEMFGDMCDSGYCMT